MLRFVFTHGQAASPHTSSTLETDSICAGEVYFHVIKLTASPQELTVQPIPSPEIRDPQERSFGVKKMEGRNADRKRKTKEVSIT